MTPTYAYVWLIILSETDKGLLIFNLQLQLLGLTVANRSVLGGMSKVISTIINIIINTTISIININNITCHHSVHE